MNSPLPDSAKRLHEMNRLGDMGRFPMVVYAGATGNVLLSVALFYWLYGRFGGHLLVGFTAAVALVGLNLLPVAVLRWIEGSGKLTNTPPITQMSFFRDQHRFATWVYAVASGNLFFWLMLAWTAFGIEHHLRTLWLVEATAFLCTLAPVWARGFTAPA